MVTGTYVAHTRPRVQVATGAEPPWVLCTQAPVGERESEDPHPTPTRGRTKGSEARLVPSPPVAGGGGALHGKPLSRARTVRGHLTESPSHG